MPFNIHLVWHIAIKIFIVLRLLDKRAGMGGTFSKLVVWTFKNYIILG